MVDFQSRDTRGGAGGLETPDETDEAADSRPDEPEPNSTETAEGVLGFGVVTVGSEHTVDDDTAGDAVVEAVGDVGKVVIREVIDDRYDGVQSTVGSLADRGDVDVVVTLGGTGPEPGDVTVDAVAPLLDKHLPGIGELLRRRFVEKRDTAAVRTRAMGGTLDGVPVFCLPGDPELAETAAIAVVVPEAGTIAELAALPVEEE